MNKRTVKLIAYSIGLAAAVIAGFFARGVTSSGEIQSLRQREVAGIVQDLVAGLRLTNGGIYASFTTDFSGAARSERRPKRSPAL